MSERRSGVLLTLAAALLWGTSWVATDFALEGFSGTAVAAWRGLMAAIFLWLLIQAGAAGAEARAPHCFTRPQLLRLAVLGLFGGACFITGMTYAVALSDPTMAAFVAGLYPVLAAAGAGLVLGEHPGPRVYAGVGSAFVGVLLMAGFDPAGAPVAGVLVGLGAAAAFALYLLLARRWSRAWRLPPLVVAFTVFLAVFLVNLPLTLLVQGPAGLAAGGGGLLPWLALLWLGGPAGAMGQASALAGVRRLPAHLSSAFLLLNPLTATVLDVILLGQRPGAAQLLGAALVLAGIAAATIPLGRTRTVETSLAAEGEPAA